MTRTTAVFALLLSLALQAEASEEAFPLYKKALAPLEKARALYEQELEAASSADAGSLEREMRPRILMRMAESW